MRNPATAGYNEGQQAAKRYLAEHPDVDTYEQRVQAALSLTRGLDWHDPYDDGYWQGVNDTITRVVTPTQAEADAAAAATLR